jgi:hypothetical protein
MGEPPSNGAYQVIDTSMSEFTVKVGVKGVLGIAAANIVTSEESALSPTRFLA